MRLHGVDEGGEALVGGEHRLCVERVDAERQRGQVERAADRIGRDAGGGAGAVVERQPFLRSGLKRLQAQPVQRRVGIEILATHLDLEVGRKPEHRAGDIGERHEVARCADRAALVDMRMGARIEEGHEAFDDLEPDARGPLHQRIGAKQHRGAHILGRQARAGGALVVPHGDALHLDQLFVADILVGHAAEERRHAVDLLALVQRILDDGARAVHAVDDDGVVGERDLRALSHGPDVGDAEPVAADDDGHDEASADV
jgi:hypothetical protein